MAGDREVLLAIKNAMDMKLVEAILVGNKGDIETISREIGLDLEKVKIIDESDDVLGSRKATELVSTGGADILMKGLVGTPVLLKQVLDKEIGLRTDKIISHVAVFDIASYHKIFMVTDAAMNIAQHLSRKRIL